MSSFRYDSGELIRDANWDSNRFNRDVSSDFNMFPRDAEREFKSFQNLFNSTMERAVTASIITGVVGSVAMVAVVYFLIDCLKKAGTAIPSFARMSTHDSEKLPLVDHSAPSRVISLTTPAISPGSNQEAPDEFINLGPRRFSLGELHSITNDYQKELGSGGYGDIYEGRLPNGTLVAVKLLKNAEESSRKQFEEEVMSSGTTRHINLVKLYGYCVGPPCRALVCEYMEKGSLDRFLLGDMTEIDWPKVHKIAVGTAKGIAYLHEECEPKIVHCDIKPGNILLDGNFSPKVADFGFAKIYENGQILLSGFHGTPNYAAPEMREPNSVTYKCDVYSFGMLLLEIVESWRNHHGNQREPMSTLPQRAWQTQLNNELSEMVHWVPATEREQAENMLKVALLCINHKPDARPEMSDVVKMLEGERDIPEPECPFESSDLDNPYQVPGSGSE